MTTQTPEKAAVPAMQKPTAGIRPFAFRSRDPFETMRELMDSVFEARGFPDLSATVQPAVNLYEKDGTYTLECAVPGYKREDITVEARGDEVTISGSYSQEKTENKNHYHRRELQQGSFSRTIVIPQEVDPEQVTAKLENGMLRVTLHPTKAIKSKTIPITG